MWTLSLADSSISLFKRETPKEKLGRYLRLQKKEFLSGGGHDCFLWRKKLNCRLLIKGGEPETKEGCGAQGRRPRAPVSSLPWPQKSLLMMNLWNAWGKWLWGKGRKLVPWFLQAGLSQRTRKSECRKHRGGEKEGSRKKQPARNPLNPGGVRRPCLLRGHEVGVQPLQGTGRPRLTPGQHSAEEKLTLALPFHPNFNFK